MSLTDFIAAESGIRQLQARYADAVWCKDYEAFGDGPPPAMPPLDAPTYSHSKLT